VYCDAPQIAVDGFENPASPYLKLRYLGRPTIVVRGSITRNLYHFSAILPVQTVDVRDARFLLASTLFGVAQ
jgi:hypothetical protein